MAWVRSNASPGEVVANDYAADAGIWITYKTGLPILAPRVRSGGPTAEDRELLGNVTRLELSPPLQQLACARGVRYVYHGATGTDFHPRSLPPLPAQQPSHPSSKSSPTAVRLSSASPSPVHNPRSLGPRVAPSSAIEPRQSLLPRVVAPLHRAPTCKALANPRPCSLNDRHHDLAQSLRPRHAPRSGHPAPGRLSCWCRSRGHSWAAPPSRTQP